jgi:glutathione synthase/RimK-type ligase-like ATP-grasp enzyme
MQAAKVAVAPFVAAGNVVDEMKKAKPSVQLPLVARPNFHQGGNDFFTCLTKTHVLDTIKVLKERLGKDGYFQNYIDVTAEYRIHIFNGEMIVAAKKTPRDNIEEAYKEQQTEKIAASAEKKGEKLDKKTLDFALQYQAGKIAGPDNIIKSNTRGYKFVPVAAAKIPASLIEESKKAVQALGLAFGAVDCVLDSDNKAWVLEVNTGPGLEGNTFDAYVEAFKKLLFAKKQEPVKQWDTGKAVAPKTAAVGGKMSTSKAAQLRVLADLVEVADDKEQDVINNLAKKLFG